MPLTMLPAGQASIVQRVTGRDETRQFLASLGFVEGGEISVVNEINGNLIVNIKDSRVALSRSMACRILVS